MASERTKSVVDQVWRLMGFGSHMILPPLPLVCAWSDLASPLEAVLLFVLVAKTQLGLLPCAITPPAFRSHTLFLHV